MEALRPEPMQAGELSESLIAEAEKALLAQFDMKSGGFGAAPKFPMTAALGFLIRRSLVSENPAAGQAARRMLEAMAQGGFHDQLGGGFHRYSVDESWTIPHFEKMADDNAGLLRNYIDGYAVFGDERYRETALDIIRFTREVLSDPGGGFYGSQDADVTPDDEGGYFTWTEEEFRKPLDPEEYAVLSAFLLHPEGSMHHDPAKKVLFVTRSLPELAGSLGKNVEDVKRVIESGKKKLFAARALRETPLIDKAFYTSMNGMLIASYFHAFAVLGDEDIRAFGTRSLDRILKERFVDGRLMHTEDVPAVLDDYIHLIDALVSGYEATAEKPYLAKADELMTACMEKYYDRQEGGFFDTETEVLGTRLKRMEDIPQPSANALAVLLLLKLSLMTGKDEYQKAARQTLGIFLEMAREIGAHAGAFFVSLDASFRMLKLTVEAPPESKLAARGARPFRDDVHGDRLWGRPRPRHSVQRKHVLRAGQRSFPPVGGLQETLTIVPTHCANTDNDGFAADG